MKNQINYLLLLLICLTQSLFGGAIRDKTETTIQNLYEDKVTLQFEKISIEKSVQKKIEKKIKKRFFKDFVYVWTIIKDDSLSGFAVLDNVFGKAMPITYLVIFDKSGSIKNVSVVKYREAYGGQISNTLWLNQFTGKALEMEITQDNIDGISGATISVNAITKGVKKLLLLYPFLNQKVSF